MLVDPADFWHGSTHSAALQVSALAPDGRCKAFADDADGYGRGEGFAALMMEPLRSEPAGASAEGQPGDAVPAQRVLAVYAGSSVNQVGRSREMHDCCRCALYRHELLPS